MYLHLAHLYILSFEVGHLVCKPPRGVHGAHHWLPLVLDAVVQGDAEVVLPKARGLVDHTRPTLRRHVRVAAGRAWRGGEEERKEMMTSEERERRGACVWKCVVVK